MLNPEFWLDEELAKISPHARLFYQGLWGICDDNYATFPNKIGWLKAQIFPYEDVNVQGLLDELSAIGKIISFESDGQKYWFIKNFFKYQKVDRPSLPKYPCYQGGLGEGSARARTEVKLSKEKRSSVRIEGFDKFWEEYPKKENKQITEVVWMNLNPNSSLQEKIIKDVKHKKNTDDWKREGGKYIPQPKNYIQGRRWEDKTEINTGSEVDAIFGKK